jgi:hypothetical protein
LGSPFGGTSHHALLHDGHSLGFDVSPFFPGGALREALATHSWPQRSHRYPGTLIMISAMPVILPYRYALVK